VKETKTAGESLTESNNINKSLLTLGKWINCICADFLVYRKLQPVSFILVYFYYLYIVYYISKDKIFPIEKKIPLKMLFIMQYLTISA